MSRPNRPTFDPGWEPRRRGPISFGSDDPAPQLVRLEGGYLPPAIPADFRSGPPGGGSAPTEVVEPNHGWWNQDGAFGFRYQGDVPPLAGTIIPLTEQLRLPGPPRLWWIHWFRYSRGVGGELDPYGDWDLRGRVTYGVGGAQNIVECDVMSGIQMALVCNSIKVDLVTYAPIIESDGAETYDPGGLGFIAGAMFGDGSAGGALPASWSTPAYVAPAGDMIVDIPLPDFARSLCLHTSVPTPADLAGVNLYFNTPGKTIKAVNAQTLYDQLTTEKGIAIPAQCNQIRLQVTAAVATSGSYFSLQFFLAL